MPLWSVEMLSIFIHSMEVAQLDVETIEDDPELPAECGRRPCEANGLDFDETGADRKQAQQVAYRMP